MSVYRRYTVAADESGLRVQREGGPTRSLRWTELSHVAQDRHRLVIHAANGETVVVPLHRDFRPVIRAALSVARPLEATGGAAVSERSLSRITGPDPEGLDNRLLSVAPDGVASGEEGR